MDIPDHPPAIQPTPVHAPMSRRCEIVNRLARSIDWELSSGEIAELRKLRPEQPPPTFWKLLSTHFDEKDVPSESDEERSWAAIISGMAEMKQLHRPGCQTGKVLAEHLHPQRFLRLLRARDRSLRHAVGITARHLAAKRASIDWDDLARLVLSSGKDDEERARRALARDYYAVQQRND